MDNDARRDIFDRFHRAESLALGSQEIRLGAAAFLGSLLKRAPLTSPEYSHVAAFVEALWYDLEALTPDPDSPTLEDGRVIPVPHPRLAESNPSSKEEVDPYGGF